MSHCGEAGPLPTGSSGILVSEGGREVFSPRRQRENCGTKLNLNLNLKEKSEERGSGDRGRIDW